MENRERLIRAEDILLDDSLTGKLIEKEWQDEDLPLDELALSRDIHRVVKGGRLILDNRQKDFIDARIIRSIRRSKRIKYMALVGFAAAIFALIGLAAFFQLQNESEIRNFASRISTQTDSKQTQLLLSANKEIRIGTKESRIEYSKTGNQIKIDDQRKVEQPNAIAANTYNTVLVPYGKRSQITLSDHSKVWLNSGSKLVYPIKFVAEKRVVFLEGEALFEVAPDKNHPFHVLTRDMEIKVLGTVFDLCAYADEQTTSTVLEHGSVELIFNRRPLLGEIRETMVPGMMALYDLSDKTLVQKNVNVKDYSSWKDGYLVLEKKSLGSISKQLSRYFNVSIEFENQKLAEETFSGYLDLRNSVHQVLTLISEMMDIEVVQTDRLIKIRKK
jgi:transmembrane sensor